MLTDQQYSVIRRRVTEFKSANAAARSKIIEEVADNIERLWQEDMPLDRDTLVTVRALHSP
jgi:hypothetical protein